MKGAVHMTAGDTEKGAQVINAASHSSAVALGGLAGGPAGAIAGGLLYDALLTGIQSAMDNQDNKEEDKEEISTSNWLIFKIK